MYTKAYIFIRKTTYNVLFGFPYSLYIIIMIRINIILHK